MQNITQAVILAGGQGLRLRPLTNTIPKPMVPIRGRPFLEYLIERLRENGITDVVLLTGYMADKISGYFGDGSRLGINIRYSVGAVEDDTGTRIRNASEFLRERFLLLYCDNYWPLDLEALDAFHRAQGGLATMTVWRNSGRMRKNNVRVDGEGFVTGYDRKRRAPDLNGLDIGFFVLEKRSLDPLPPDNFSFEDVVLPRLIAGRRLAGFMTDHRYYSIGSPDRLPETEEFLRPRKIILLDRDGVINERPPRGEYVKNIGELKFLPGAFDALRLLKTAGFEIYIVSNQAGVGRGIMQDKEVEEINAYLMREAGRAGGAIDAIYYCPHAWNAGCECRKPKPGMLFRAAEERLFDLTRAVFVGDDERDMQAGEAAGCRTLLVSPGKDLLDIVRREILPVKSSL